MRASFSVWAVYACHFSRVGLGDTGASRLVGSKDYVRCLPELTIDGFGVTTLHVCART